MHDAFRNGWAARVIGVCLRVALACQPALALASTPAAVDEAFQALGIRVTTGAAPGYVNDEACGICHKEYASYQAVAMAKSFYRPSPDKAMEDFEHGHFYHEPSRRHYRLSLRDGEYWFERYQLDAEGQPINRYEQRVDWIVGSGNHVRTYLYQTPIGEIYELPLAWYSQERKWGMQPGYEKADHKGVLRQVRRECMFCHNAYPDVAEGSDNHLRPHTFPHRLPEGTGCQRCHGPGEAHLRVLFGGDTDLERIRASIVNPGRLSAQRRDDVCFECHMLPAVAVTPLRRFGRADYSFRPGQDLADYLVAFDIREEHQEPGERFEINHHPYRLLQSRCYQESEGRMSCLTCHDPHVKLPPQRRAGHYREKCLACHTGFQHPPLDGESLDDCSRCHMPERRTQDVIEVTMTDHRIQVPAAGVDLTAPLEKQSPVITDLMFLEPQRAPVGDLGAIYLILGILKPHGHAPLAMLEQLRDLLRRSPQATPVPYLALAEGLRGYRRFEQMLEVLRDGERQVGVNAKSLVLSAVAHIGLQQYRQARESLYRAIELDAELPEAHYNLAVLLKAQGELEKAESHLLWALALRPNMSVAWHYLGLVAEQDGRHAEARAHFRRALEIDPGFGRAYLGIAGALQALGERDEALRYLAHGAEHAISPAAVREALEKAEQAALKVEQQP